MRVSKIACLSLVCGWMLGGNVSAQTSTPVETGVELSWSVPTARVNGTVLKASELSGYELYYTTDSPQVGGTIKVSGGATSSYYIHNLPAGNYHFAMAAIDVNGLKSKLSSIVEIKVTASY